MVYEFGNKLNTSKCIENGKNMNKEDAGKIFYVTHS